MEPPSKLSSPSLEPASPRAKITVLIAEDDQTSLANLAAAMEESGYLVVTAADGAEAIAKLKGGGIDVVVSDMRMAGLGGMEVVEYVSAQAPETAVILVTGYGNIETAVEAMRKGAYDYLTKPVDLDKLELLVEKAVQKQKLVTENVRLRRQLSEKYSFASIVGRSALMQRAFSEIEQVAKTNAKVLIQGESGTGKELVASAIHHHSLRADGPLIKVNCEVFVEGLVESELFGHEKGAFTGASKARKGRIELAHDGTLFLDEIADLRPSTQLKLLRVLQEGEIERVGGSVPVPVDVRLIAATNKDLEKEVAAGRFREELYYRIKVITIKIPALRERAEDIPLLLEHFTRIFNQEHNKQVQGLSPAAARLMARYSWPGNIRELRNMVESLVVMARGPIIEERDLPKNLLEQSPEEQLLSVPIGSSLAEAERLMILGTLRLAKGNKSRASQILGIGKKTLYRKLREYGMLPDEKELPPDE